MHQKIESGWMVRLMAGEQVMHALLNFLQDKKVTGGFITAIGALRKIKLGYFDLPEKTYFDKHFEDDYELVSFSGNISLVDGKPFIHAHAVIADRECQVWGGHFFDAEVAVTMEVHIQTTAQPIERASDELTGLKLLKLTK